MKGYDQLKYGVGLAFCLVLFKVITRNWALESTSSLLVLCSHSLQHINDLTSVYCKKTPVYSPLHLFRSWELWIQALCLQQWY